MDKTETTEQFQNAATLSLELTEEQMAGLYLFLQNGFFVKAEVGCTMEDFFLNQLNLSPEYVQTRIQGIFLDGKPADHIDTAIIRDGTRLTLSGTMPGLAGMALKSGPLAVFRHGITHRETGDYTYSGDGYVQLKLLNLLMKDMGPELLRKGIYTYSAELTGFLGNLSAEFWQGCKTVSLNDRDVAPEMILKKQWISENKVVRFRVVAV